MKYTISWKGSIFIDYKALGKQEDNTFPGHMSMFFKALLYNHYNYYITPPQTKLFYQVMS